MKAIVNSIGRMVLLGGMLWGLMCGGVMGQDDNPMITVKIDEKTGHFDKRFPIDQVFLIELQLGKGETVDAIHIQQMISDRKRTRLEKRYKNQDEKRYEYLNGRKPWDRKGERLDRKANETEAGYEIQRLKFKTIKGKEGKSTIIATGIPLKPRKDYRLWVSKKPTGSDLNKLTQIGWMIHTGADLSKAREKYGPFETRIKNGRMTKVPFYPKNNMVTGENYLGFTGLVQKKWATEFQKWKGAETALRAVPDFDVNDTTTFQKLSQMAIACSCKVDLPLAFQDSLSPAWKDLLQLRGVKKVAFLRGMRKLPLQTAEGQIEESNYSGRITNIEKILPQLEKYVDFIEWLAIHDPSFDPHSTGRVLKEWISSMAEVKSSMTKVRDKVSTRFQPWSFTEGSTSKIALKQRIGQHIFPDVGLAGWLPGPSADELKVTPYVGAYITFRGIDTNIPWRYNRNRSFWHVFALQVGVTMTSVELEGRRKDLFGKNSLLLGAAFRVNNSIHVTGGTMWFQQVNPAPLNDDFQLAFTPYISLAFDLRIRNALGAVGKLLFPSN